MRGVCACVHVCMRALPIEDLRHVCIDRSFLHMHQTTILRYCCFEGHPMGKEECRGNRDNMI